MCALHASPLTITVLANRTEDVAKAHNSAVIFIPSDMLCDPVVCDPVLYDPVV